MAGNLLLAGALQRAREELFVPEAQRRWTAGAVVYDPRADNAEIIFPYSGVAALLTPVGSSSILTGAVGCDGAIGLLQAFTPQTGSTVAVALSDMDAWAVDRATFRKICDEDRPFADLIGRYVEFLALEAEREIACRSCHDGRKRVAGWLGHLFDVSRCAELRLNQAALAQMFCVQRTTMNSFAKALKQSGALRYRRVALSLGERTELDRRACGCRAEVVQARLNMDLPTSIGEQDGRDQWNVGSDRLVELER